MAVGRYTKIIDERHATKKGLIRIEVWADSAGNVGRYNLAYINWHIFGGDKGRVFGFDNAHMYPGFTSLHFASPHALVRNAATREAIRLFRRHLPTLRANPTILPVSLQKGLLT